MMKLNIHCPLNTETLWTIISALQTFEFYVFGTSFPSITIVITDQFNVFGLDKDKCHIVSHSGSINLL